MKKLLIFSLGFFVLLLAVAYFNNSAEAAEWTNLYNDPLNQYPSFNSTWDTTHYYPESEHTITIWNDGSTSEDFLDSIFVLNEVFYINFLSWNDTNKYFTDGTYVIRLNSYDGLFDNSDGAIANMQVGIWPYFEVGNLYAAHDNEAVVTFITEGSYFYLEGDTLAHVTAVPEPMTIFLFLSGLAGLMGVKIKR
jgi:hypothetical protein